MGTSVLHAKQDETLAILTLEVDFTRVGSNDFHRFVELHLYGAGTVACRDLPFESRGVVSRVSRLLNSTEHALAYARETRFGDGEGVCMPRFRVYETHVVVLACDACEMLLDGKLPRLVADLWDRLDRARGWDARGEFGSSLLGRAFESL